jgi:hypothetical protein
MLYLLLEILLFRFVGDEKSNKIIFYSECN